MDIKEAILYYLRILDGRYYETIKHINKDIENGSIRGSVGPIDSVFWELEKEHRITKITCEKMSEEQLFEHEKYPYEEFYVVNEIKT